TRVAAEGQIVTFSIAVQNFSNADLGSQYFLHVEVDGAERLEASQPLTSLPAASLTNHTFQIGFNRTGYANVKAFLERLAQDVDEGVDGDDARYAVVEVRKKVDVLVIDGAGKEGLRPGGDTLHLQTVFASAAGYQVVQRGVEELEKPGLEQQYPSIFL